MAIAAIIRIIATTISSSISEKPACAAVRRSRLLSEFLGASVINSPSLKKEGKSFDFPIWPRVLRYLLQRRAGNRWCRTVQRVADHARFVGEESALARGADTLRNRRGDEGVPNSSTTNDRAGCSTGVPRLVTATQTRMDQASRSNRGHEAGDASTR